MSNWPLLSQMILIREAGGGGGGGGRGGGEEGMVISGKQTLGKSEGGCGQ